MFGIVLLRNLTYNYMEQTNTNWKMWVIIGATLLVLVIFPVLIIFLLISWAIFAAVITWKLEKRNLKGF